MSGPKRLATIVLAASMALSISGCASTYTGGTGDVARLEALAAAEAGYSGCTQNLSVARSGATFQSHSDFPDCVAIAMAAQSEPWCTYSSSVRGAVAVFAGPTRLLHARRNGLDNSCSTSESQERSFLALVREYSLTQNRSDGLDDFETALLRDAKLNLLRFRCRFDLEQGIQMAPEAAQNFLGDGEALLCASISERWSSARLRAYWP